MEKVARPKGVTDEENGWINTLRSKEKLGINPISLLFSVLLIHRYRGRQVVKSSATLFRDKIKRREIIQTFTRTGIDEMNNSNKLVFRNE